MIIDFHAHAGDFRYSAESPYSPLTFNDLIARLDEEGIDKAVFLPVYNASPESRPLGIICGEGMSLHDQVIEAEKYLDRLIPFGNMDPRYGKDFSELLDWFQAHSCRGIGEVMTNLPYDDPRVINMFRQIGERDMFITIESSPLPIGHTEIGAGFMDDPGLPRLEKLLHKVPETIIIGHGPGVWAEISKIDFPEEKNGYPLVPVKKGGSLPRLLKKEDNLYADLSACSAFSALVRDFEFGIEFLNEFQDKLLFGTDLIAFNRKSDREKEQKRHDELLDMLFTRKQVDRETFFSLNWHKNLMPQLQYLKALRAEKLITDIVFNKITSDNAMKLLKL